MLRGGCKLCKAGRCPTRRETARWISLRASEASPPTPLSVSGLRRCHLSRGERQGRPNAGVCSHKAGRLRLAGRRLAGSACGLARHRPLHPLSVNALRHCHLSQRERQERSNAGAGYALAPPLGELSPQVTERAEQRHCPCTKRREEKCRGRPPDVPQHKRKCRLYKAGRCPIRRETACWISLRAS